MGQRITIVMVDDLMKKLRELQAKTILRNVKSGNSLPAPSFSKIVNDTLSKGITKRGSSLGWWGNDSIFGG